MPALQAAPLRRRGFAILNLPRVRHVPKFFLAAMLQLAVTACALVPQQGRASEPIFAFVGANVIPATDAETMLSDQTLIVRSGRIVEVGPRSRVSIPSGAIRIAARGKFLIPGLADMHVHLEHLPDPDILKLFVAHGVTTVRNMDGRPYILDWRASVERGELVGPRIATAGPIIDGSPPLRDDNFSVADPNEAASAVRTQHAAGYDFIKVYTNLAPEAYTAVLSTARGLKMPVVGHIPRRVVLADAVTAMESIEHLSDLGRELDARPPEEAAKWHWSKLFLGMPINEQKLRHLTAQLAHHQTWVVPTLVERDRAIGSPDDLRQWLRLPQMQLVPQDGLDHWLEQARKGAARMGDEDWELLRRARSNRLKTVAALHQAGVNLLTGTDTPNAFVVPGASLHEELALFVEAGMTPGQALLFATRGPARFLNSGDSSGIIARGYRADLVLLNSNPLRDIRATRDIAGVMVAGRWLNQSDLGAAAQALRR